MRLGYCHFDSWSGRLKARVEILKETPKRYKVRFLEDVMRRFSKDQIAYAPKRSVTIDKETQR